MKWFRDQELMARVRQMDKYIEELRAEVVWLRGACTMRVGIPNPYSYSDRRPVLTAMQALQKLMEDAGIEPKPVEPVSAVVEFVQAEKAPK